MRLHCVLFACLANQAASTPLLPRRKSSNLLQSARLSSGIKARAASQGQNVQAPIDNVWFGDGPARSDSFFVRDFEKMDELPGEPAKCNGECDINNVIIMSTTANPMVISAAVEERPQQFLAKESSKLPPKFMPKKGCHPRCSWKCENKDCKTKCAPRCKAPSCVTACEKPKLGECSRTCRDPMCAVVCPPDCEHGSCPKCKTVCGDPICTLDCGNRRCESRCADPECVWDCAPDSGCETPKCSLECEQTVCTFGKDQKLPSEVEAPYLGQEVTWKGFARVPPSNLKEYASKMMTGPLTPPGALPMSGALPVPAGGLQSIKQDMGINRTAKFVGWSDNNAPCGSGAPKITPPSVLTDRSILGPHT